MEVNAIVDLIGVVVSTPHSQSVTYFEEYSMQVCLGRGSKGKLSCSITDLASR